MKKAHNNLQPQHLFAIRVIEIERAPHPILQPQLQLSKPLSEKLHISPAKVNTGSP